MNRLPFRHSQRGLYFIPAITNRRSKIILKPSSQKHMTSFLKAAAVVSVVTLSLNVSPFVSLSRSFYTHAFNILPPTYFHGRAYTYNNQFFDNFPCSSCSIQRRKYRVCSTLSNNNNLKILSESEGERAISISEEEKQLLLASLTQRNKTWKRLSQIMDLLALHPTNNSNKGKNEKRVAVDIGCDHGLLSIALALSDNVHCFDQVYGIDVSQDALENGALLNQECLLQNTRRILHQQKDNIYEGPINDDRILQALFPNTSLDFRVSDGLSNLLLSRSISQNKNSKHDNGKDHQHMRKEEIESYCFCFCMAGMGVNSIMTIVQRDIFPFVSSIASMINKQKRVEINIAVQPASARPRHLVTLYDIIQEQQHDGDYQFTLKDEKITQISNRFYISSVFSCNLNNINPSSTSPDVSLPGAKLSLMHSQNAQNEEAQKTKKDNEATMYDLYLNYVKHHSSWLKLDCQQRHQHYRNSLENNSSCINSDESDFLSPEDQRWLHFVSSDKN